MITEKSVSAYKTISEVSKLIDVPSHVLRFWETKFSQVKPVKRSGARRYYRAEDIEILTLIRELLYNEGYTIKGAQKALKSQFKNSGTANNIQPKGNQLDKIPKDEFSSAEKTDFNMDSCFKILEILRDSENRLNKLISKNA